MNIYSNKKRWKLLLFGSAAVVFLVIIYYSNLLISNIANEERRRVELWADAISYKAELVNYTEKFFQTIKIEEGKRVSIFAQALQKVNEASWDEDITFYQNIISSNTTIPSIIVHENGEIDCAVNVSPEVSKMKNISELGNQCLITIVLKFNTIRISTLWSIIKNLRYIQIFVLSLII
jgi:hypothetical protein